MERAALRDAAVDDLGTALGEGVDPHGAGEAQDARDLLGALVFGVDQHRKADRVAQKLGLGQVFGIADAGDDVLRAEPLCREGADHVGLVALGHGHEDVCLRRAALAQRVGIGRTAEHADDVERIGYRLDRGRIAVDHRDVMALGLQALRDTQTDPACAGNNDFHKRPPCGNLLPRFVLLTIQYSMFPRTCTAKAFAFRRVLW